MAGIRTEAKLWPSVWASLGDQDGEPLFIAVDDAESGPAVGLLTLGLVQEWGAQIASGDMEESPYADLHILLPGCFRLVPCELSVDPGVQGPWLVARDIATQAELHRSQLD